LAWPLFVAPFSGWGWVGFIEQIAPHLTQNQIALAAALGFVSIIFISNDGTAILLLLNAYFQGHQKIN
jgi:hypothetical protein